METWRPPEQIALADVGAVVRRYRMADADPIHEAIEASRDHLRPFMFWADQTRDVTRRFVVEAEADWDAGIDYVVGIFDADRDVVLGGGGLHRRGGAESLEIGYWRRADAGGRGLVTAMARALTGAAFTNPAIEAVEIHCDVANRASAAVPKRLGFELREIISKDPAAPAETGRHQVWVTRRSV
ncbi:MAG: GNAT family N-acetyltransferase [Desertimonas sp.]